MFTKPQEDIVNELYGYGIEINEEKYDTLPAFSLGGFPQNEKVLLVPLINSGIFIFQVIIIKSNNSENDLVKSVTKTFINTNIKNITELLYIYYHHFKLIQRETTDININRFWLKILKKYNFEEIFNKNNMKRHLINYFLNTTKTEETKYISK